MYHTNRINGSKMKHIFFIVLLYSQLAGKIFLLPNEGLVNPGQEKIIYDATRLEIQLENINNTFLQPLNQLLSLTGIEAINETEIESITDSARNYFLNSFSALTIEELKSGIYWYTSPTGQKVVKIETGEYTNLEQDSPNDEKKKLIEKLVNISGVIESSEEFMDRLTSEMIEIVLYAGLKQRGEFSIEKYKSKINSPGFIKMKPKLVQDLKDKGLIQNTLSIEKYYNKYSALSEDEIKEYIAFNETATGQKILEIFRKSLLKYSDFFHTVFKNKFNLEL